MTYDNKNLNNIKLEKIRSKQQEFSRVFRLLNTHTNTDTTDFINKYHKRSKVWSNKIAYLAGLIDGEGYLKVEKWGTIRLTIGMTDEKTICWIQENFGGNVKEQKTPKGKPFYVWRMNQGKDLFYLLLLVIPFLITKKEILTDALKNLIDKLHDLEHTLKNFKKDLEGGV